MKYILKTLAATSLSLATVTHADWFPTGGAKEIAVINITEEMSGCNLPAPGEGWVQVGFVGDQYNYFFKIREAPTPKSMLATLLSAQTAGQFVQVQWAASTKDCGGSRYITGIKVGP